MGRSPRKGTRLLAGGLLAATAGIGGFAFTRALSRMDLRIGKKGSAGRVFAFTDRDADGERIRFMMVGGAVQSGTYLGEKRFELPFAYYRAFDRLFEARPHARNVLMLGGGGFAWPKHALTSREELLVDVCEPESAVVDAARRWFFLDELEERAGE